MAFEGDTYGMRTLDFVERLQRLTDYDEICQLIMKEMEWFGFSCVTSFSIPGPGENLEASIQLNNRPKEYTERYVEKNYVLQDPAVTELRKTINPYSWNDIRERR